HGDLDRKMDATSILTEGVLQVSKSPEHWVFSIWCPNHEAVPHREPDELGISDGNPVNDVLQSTGEEPVYFLESTECNWVHILEIVLVLNEEDKSLERKLRKALLEQRNAAVQRWRLFFDPCPEEAQQPRSRRYLDFGDPEPTPIVSLVKNTPKQD
ncbi:MAG: hypothetical protein WD180_13120, partial [Pseudohongiellaceae bacterium]